MIDNKMEEVRQRLNQMVILQDINKEDLLKISQELDILIVQSMREKHKNANESKEYR